MSKITIEQIWEALLEAEEKVVINVATMEEAMNIKQNLSVYKSRMLKDSMTKELLGEAKLKFTISDYNNDAQTYTLIVEFDNRPYRKEYKATLEVN